MEALDSAKFDVETKTAELAVVRARVYDTNKKVARLNEELNYAIALNARLQDVEGKLSLVESIVISLEHKSQNYEGEELFTNN